MKQTANVFHAVAAMATPVVVDTAVTPTAIPEAVVTEVAAVVMEAAVVIACQTSAPAFKSKAGT
jgi:hypothetical protein